MNSRTIVLVEDNPDDIELTLMAFRDNHFCNEILVARDGEEAIAMLSPSGVAGKAPPAVVLLDLKLPGMSGLDVLAQVRGQPHTRRVPVVVLTSSKQNEDLLASYDLGCNAYVRKPVDFSEFIKTSKQLGLFWLLLNESP